MGCPPIFLELSQGNAKRSRSCSDKQAGSAKRDQRQWRLDWSGLAVLVTGFPYPSSSGPADFAGNASGTRRTPSFTEHFRMSVVPLPGSPSQLRQVSRLPVVQAEIRASYLTRYFERAEATATAPYEQLPEPPAVMSRRTGRSLKNRPACRNPKSTA